MISKIEKAFPRPLLEQGEGWQEFSDALTELMTELTDDVIGMRGLLSPEETPYPDVLAESLGAYSSVYDDADGTRRKAAGAVRFAKNRRLFDESWKPVLDRIMGTDTRIWRGKWTQGGFRMGVDYMGLKPMGGAGGLVMGGGNMGEENMSSPYPPYQDWQPGDVLIDLREEPTELQARRIRAQFEQVCPTYFRVWIGYTDQLPADYLAGDYTPGDYLTSIEVFIVYDFLNRYQYTEWRR